MKTSTFVGNVRDFLSLASIKIKALLYVLNDPMDLDISFKKY